MFKQVEALNFRSLRYVQQPLKRFHILIGPNASGKSTFLDVIRFLGDLIQPTGIEEAIQSRTPDWQDLVWMHESNSFELAVEVAIPEDKRQQLINPEWDTCRYQVRIGQESFDQPVGILSEMLLLKHDTSTVAQARSLFPSLFDVPNTILEPTGRRGHKTIVNKVPGGNDNFYDETGGGWDHAFKLGTQRSALGNLPEDETKFPVATWFKRTLMDGVTFLHLDSDRMSRPSPPGRGIAFRPDGSNLPWVVKDLQQNHPNRFGMWIKHIQTSLPDINSVETEIRAEDRHSYLRVHYDTGLIVPSWGLSDGTLRMFALTLLPYLPKMRGTFLIEEPENGIHPRAVETVYESLSSVYQAQVLVATHSPVLLSVAKLQEVLCFARTENGATDIVSGELHPRLLHWQHESDLGTLFAGGVLG